MKNLSLILNIVLLAAVGVLYYLHFTSGKTSSSSTTAGSSLPSDVKIAYINSDTVLKYYDYHKTNQERMEAKANKLRQEYRARATGLQSEVNAYQRNVNTMTLGQVRAVEEDLQKKQQNLQMYEQSLTQQLMEEQEKMNKELYDRITTYLKKYSEENGIQFVLKYDLTSDVLYGGQALDVSQDVIKGLNEELKTGAVKADSTTNK